MKKKLLKSLTGLVVAGSLLLPSIGMAQSATSTSSLQASSPQATTTAQINSISALIQQIQALQNQINALKASQVALELQTATEFNAFLTDLSLGSRGDAVIALQALLAANPNIYPEGLITGFFGKATEKALKRLQKENGLEQAGRVGPKTRHLLNKLLKDNRVAFEDEDSDDDDDDDDNDNATSTDRRRGRGRGERGRSENHGRGSENSGRGNGHLCAIVPPGHLVAPGWLKKHDGERPLIPECQRLPRGIEKKLDDDRRFGTTTPDTTAPTVRDLLATSTATSTSSGQASATASITWFTNENATSTLWYGTTTPLNTATAIRLDNNTWKKSHIYDLVGLTASTTYYYLIKVSDMAGNSAVITEHSFMTPGN